MKIDALNLLMNRELRGLLSRLPFILICYQLLQCQPTGHQLANACRLCISWRPSSRISTICHAKTIVG
jgi:hypothetical protein